jgi:itaconate CoA-transferase
MTAESPMGLPLTGIVVVAVEQAVAAPLATRHLADLGARVIKVERPGTGDFARGYDGTVHGLSSHFVWLNQGKQSIELDIGSPEGRQVLDALVARADVVVQNLAPATARKHGLAAELLVQRHPRLVACDVSGYGPGGPYSDRKAYDLLIQCETGLVSITGTPERPAKAGISVADIAAGMYAYSGILTALFARATTGLGTSLEVSLFDALGEWMGQPAYFAGYGGTAPRRSGAHHASIAPYGPFRVGDRGSIYLGIQNAREWTRFCTDVLRRPELADDEDFRTNPERVTNREALHAAIEIAFVTLTVNEVIERLDAAGIAWARMNSVGEFLEHPQLDGRWRTIGSPAGPLNVLVPPVRMDGVEPAMGDVPALGQHTDAILKELGIAPDTIAAWRSEGAI